MTSGTRGIWKLFFVEEVRRAVEVRRTKLEYYRIKEVEMINSLSRVKKIGRSS